MINVVEKKNCTGCDACVDICPKNAVFMETDSEGFWYPKVDKSVCVDCSMCNRVCPVENIPVAKTQNYEKPLCFAAINKNLYVRFDSTSGGMFSALANQILREDGLVGGACTDDDFSVKQILIDTRERLEEIRSSKYYQSDATGYYKAIKTALDNNRKVLACGTPCQMAALRNYLGKDYNNLIIVDFICLCIPSPMVFKKYIEDIGLKNKSKVISTKAKSKELGWRNLTQMFVLENGRHIYQINRDNPFQYLYMVSRTIARPSCYECKYKGFPRVSDISLGDLWSLKEKQFSAEFRNQFDNDIGTSLVIINNSKGLDFFEKCKKSILSQEIEFDSILSTNPALIKSLAPSTVNREVFFEDINKLSFDEIEKKYVKNEKSIIKEVLKKNYRICRKIGLNIPLYLRAIRLNGLKKMLSSTKGIIIPLSHTIIRIANKNSINLNADVFIGVKRVKGSKLETRFIVEDSATLEVNGKVSIGYGSDIEVFGNGKLKIGHCWTNMGTEIICTNSITIGDYVGIGRNVTIRDNNGGHYINRSFYKDSRPIIIEDKVWICSNVTIMPGVKIGEGAIIGENSFVTENVPPYTMVSGNPAKVVDTDVLFNWQTGM